MNLFYLPEFEQGNSYQLSDEESRHLIKVLRGKDGDTVHLTDGKGNLALARLNVDSKRSVKVDIVTIERIERPAPGLTIAISPVKSPARWEWFLEKSTELGVAYIQPIICERTEKHNFKGERVEKIILAAMKQSNRFYLPQINQPIPFSQYLQNEFNGQKFIAHCDEGKKINLYDNVKQGLDISFLIGPEGDFTENEIMQSIAVGYQPVSLGKYRLRTETAGIVVCQTFNFVNRL